MRTYILAVFFSIFMTGACTQYTDPPHMVAPRIIDQSIDTLATFRQLENIDSIDKHIPGAAGILILPHVVKGGFIAAAEAGTGVLLARTSDGSWSYPAFYVLGSGSIGLQLGVQDVSMILIIRNQGALQAVIENQGKFGADIGLMLGYVGAGYEGSTTTNLGADIIAFMGPGMGAFGGVSLEGAALIRRNDLNDYYYGAGALPQDIVITGKYTNAGADPLRIRIDPQ
ncbi:MAG: lipid-binding SYLF domain-containing protein [Rhodospirillales bacterium]|jgi:SH3 domain-containing YSC84-like protein 1|nr:lipid-binding SYLF domain-containing protein [Rhodospirillales bacterium]MBT4039077.1 lipid-binding SYLF domain-containing protein [Rhodospirillales bacterium]MBT5352116.1 lipid-binding SYLF domain-containing protein [Rhodospirillales bacterium]MBT5521885.1 lipid-binding SYLF domain-containing protein [Rhodospirillales bacterium]MBT6109794.1 lipid-binding SYLF domain-containing protein [Rhodospirillales bacterium]